MTDSSASSSSPSPSISSSSMDAETYNAQANASFQKWTQSFLEARSLINDHHASSKDLTFRYPEFLAEATWPFYATSDYDHLVDEGLQFLNRAHRQDIVAAFNVLHKHAREHANINHNNELVDSFVDQLFGASVEEMSQSYYDIETLRVARDDALRQNQLIPPPTVLDEPPSTSFLRRKQKKLQLPVEQPYSPYLYLQNIERQKFPEFQPLDTTPESWNPVFEALQTFLNRFQLRSMTLPLTISPEQSLDFIDRLNVVFDQLSTFTQLDPSLMGLNQWLNIQSRPFGPLSDIKTSESDPYHEQEVAINKKGDQESGWFNSRSLKIQLDTQFDPSVLVHEWFHALDLWYGSYDIFKVQPWNGWTKFATGFAFNDKILQSSHLKKWRKQLSYGHVSDDPNSDSDEPYFQADRFFTQPLIHSTFLNQMRYATSIEPRFSVNFNQNPDLFYLPYQELVAHQFQALFQTLTFTPEQQSTLETQSQALSRMFFEALVPYASSPSTPHLQQLSKEWSELASSWAERTAAVGFEASNIPEDQRASVLQSIQEYAQGLIAHNVIAFVTTLSLHEKFPAPNHDMKQAIRMDIFSGRTYYTTPHELLAFKMEHLYRQWAQDPSFAPDPDRDPASVSLMAWLRQEAAPKLQAESRQTLNLSHLFNNISLRKNLQKK